MNSTTSPPTPALGPYASSDFLGGRVHWEGGLVGWLVDSRHEECYCCGSWQHEKIFCPFAPWRLKLGLSNLHQIESMKNRRYCLIDLGLGVHNIFEDSRLQSINPSICMVTIWTFAEARIGCWISPWSLVFFGEEFGLYLGFAYLYLPNFKLQQMHFILTRVLPSLKLCMEVFVGSLLILKFALISLPFEGPWSFLQWLCWCQPCKLSTVQYMLYINNLPKIQSNPSKSIQMLCPLKHLCFFLVFLFSTLFGHLLGLGSTKAHRRCELCGRKGSDGWLDNPLSDKGKLIKGPTPPNSGRGSHSHWKFI